MTRAATTCTNHCGACHRHFHSLEAFDRHRVHDDAGWPRCVSPLDLEDRDGRPRLEPLTEDGECRVYPNAVETGITIWTTADWRERIATLKAPESPYQPA